MNTVVDVTKTQRWVTPADGGEATGPSEVGAIGISAAEFGPTHYNVASAVPATFAFTGDLGVELGKSLAKIPSKVGALVHSIGGGERDPETPISVVGASIIGGDTVDHGLWVAFWFFLAQLNFVLGAINLVPLLPFDGGHIAVAVFEKLRNIFRAARGLLPAAPVNYQKLMPATYLIPCCRGRLYGADRDRRPGEPDQIVPVETCRDQPRHSGPRRHPLRHGADSTIQGWQCRGGQRVADPRAVDVHHWDSRRQRHVAADRGTDRRRLRHRARVACPRQGTPTHWAR